MPKYEVLENRQNAKKTQRTIRVRLSDEESAFFEFKADPSQEKIDATVDLFLANREAEKIRMEAEAAIAEAESKVNDIKLSMPTE